MVVNMLKSVLVMLDKPNKSKIECARAVLTEVIAHLESGPQKPNAAADIDLSPEGQAARDELI